MLLDILYSIDTTGSMSPCIREVRRRTIEVTKELFEKIPDLRIGILAHGDYCDKNKPYVTKQMDFTNDPKVVEKFINSVENTYGGDAPECYELAMREARTEYSWRDTADKVFVLIGDDVPHKPDYSLNTQKIDWKKEVKEFASAGIKIYSVHCLNNRSSEFFYNEIAADTGGIKLKLNQFHESVELLMAICIQQKGLDELELFEFEIKSKNRMSRSLAEAFAKLSGKEVESYGYKSYDELVKTCDEALKPVSPGRFQILNVDSDCAIKKFVEDSGATFKIGRGFYEFKKTETIQENKEVVLVENESGDMWTGAKAREMIGVPLGTRGRIRPNLVKYTIFVQSTSVNRKLISGSKFLYEAA